MADFIVYGAYGYTGALIARLAKERGITPLLSGRNPEKLKALADPLGLPWRAASLDDAAGLDALLSDPSQTGQRTVLHCAGPFSRTWQAMAEACLRTGAHYLDITGEIAVFEALAGLSDRARGAGVVLMPGVGFDVVPTDCVAAWLKQRLPEATELSLAIRGSRHISHGTLTTAVENLGAPGAIRRGGEIVPVPPAHDVREIDFGEGPRQAAAIPWGDVSTAWHSTGIPDITTYMVFPPRMIRGMKMGRHIGGILRSDFVQRRLQARVDALPAGPTDEQRAAGESRIWGEALDARGNRVEERLRTPDGYTLTADAALRAAVKVAAGQVDPGFQTPSSGLGADFVLECDGCERAPIR